MSLACPSCARRHGDEERFCEDCGLPLVVEGGPAEAQLTERAQRARKVKRQYSEGSLVTVAVSRNEAEAELIQNLLLEEGVPSTLRRPSGLDLPAMAGPRKVLVPASGADTAKEILRFDERPRRVARQPRAVRVAAWVLLALILVGIGAAWTIRFAAS